MPDTSAHYLVQALLDIGIDTYFGIPGGPVSPLFEAVLRCPDTKLIESKHETAAVFEAIGYYKVTNRMPVVLVSAGPGITNAMTGMASASALNIPVIMIAGDVAWQRTDSILLQSGGPDGIDIETTFSAHCQKIIRCNDPDRILGDVNSALKDLSGPLLIIIPLHSSNAVIEKPNVALSLSSLIYEPIDQSTINNVASLLNKAIRPLLVLGFGAKQYSHSVRHLIDVINIPYITTPQGKGVASETNHLSLRHSGLGASRWARSYLSDPPDCILVLGTDLDDCAVGATQFAGPDTKIIHVDTDAKVFGRRYRTDYPVNNDINIFINQLINIYDSKLNSYSLEVIEPIKAKSAFDVDGFTGDDTVPLAPHRALADLQLAAPDARFVTDIGEHMLHSLHYLTVNNTNQFSIDLGLGSMGSGIGQSIGMVIGDGIKTITVCGDGSMQMIGMELLVAQRHNLPIVFAVFNDARYNMVWHGFKFLFGREENLGQTDYIDFVKFGEAIGIPGALITQPGQITKELLDSFTGPAILDIRIDPSIKLVGAGRNEALKQMGEHVDG